MKIFTVAFYFAILVGATFSNPQMPNAVSSHLKPVDKMLHAIPIMDKVCKQVSEDVIEEVCKDLNEAEKSVDPKEICSKLKICSK
uniref:Saposin B-type domain-containing protein n=1 Tax=Strongyloides papillosus TaxID=174720 RepID=A0A0N5BSE0_STREA